MVWLMQMLQLATASLKPALSIHSIHMAQRM